MRKKTLLFFLSVLLVVAPVLSMACSKKGKDKKTFNGKNAAVGQESAAKPVYCAFCGEELGQGTSPERPIAVMVENLKSIRPQCGLAQACIVVEGLTEGGITRFMAIYANKDVERIGPVRSARTHYVAIARGVNAIYAHCGGSIYAKQAIENLGVADLDQMRWTKVYWRTKGGAPHNLWTSTERVHSVAKAAGYDQDGEIRGFKFKSEAQPNDRPEMQNIVIDFSTAAYKVEYQYKKETNTYGRLNGGVVQTDRISGKELETKNIVVVFAPTAGIPGGGEVLDVRVLGQNRCLVFTDGKVLEGVWEKASEKAPFHLHDSKMAEIRLNRGQTWIELVKTDTKVVYDQGEVKSKKD